MQLNKSFIMESSKHYEAANEVTAYRWGRWRMQIYIYMLDQHSLAWIKLKHMCACISTFPISPTTDISCSFLLPSANMQRSSIPREPLSNSTITYALSMISGTWTTARLSMEHGVIHSSKGFKELNLVKGKIKHCRARTVNNHQTKKAMCLDSSFYSLIDRTLNSFR